MIGKLIKFKPQSEYIEWSADKISANIFIRLKCD